MSPPGTKRTGNGNLPLNTVANLENVAIELENNLTNVNKDFIRKLVNGTNAVINFLENKKPRIFHNTIRWFRLYLNVQISVDPKNEKLSKQFEKTIPTVLTHIIGCLQYKTKEIPNYHYSLLEILEEILQNMNPNILEQIVNFEPGTIACLWNPIDYARDFNTQLKTLKILSLFLKYLDNDRQNDELKSIKWTKLNLFQDKLKAIVQETKLASIFENTARELLNNYNMNLSTQVFIYSFYCKSAILGRKYEFYKPLNLEKFWIDLNYSPKTIAFNGRFKPCSESKYCSIAVSLKIENITVEKNHLLINFIKPGEFSKYSEEFSKLAENSIRLTIDDKEERRLKENQFVVEYFNKAVKTNNAGIPIADTFDMLKRITCENPKSPDNMKNVDECQKVPNNAKDVFKKSYNLLIGSSPKESDRVQNNNQAIKPDTPKNNNCIKDTINLDTQIIEVVVESPKTSKNNSDTKTRLRNKRTFFSSLLDEDIESEGEIKKSKKKSRAKKPRKSKPSVKKQIGKVIPIVDLTKINENPNKVEESKPKGEIVNLSNVLHDGAEQCIPSTSSATMLTSQQCSVILKNVGDVYNIGDSTYAEPGQSYRNFKTKPISRPVQNSIDKNISKTRGRQKQIDKLENEKKEVLKKSVGRNNKGNISNKENIASNTVQSMEKLPLQNNKMENEEKRPLQHKKRIISPHLFETQTSSESPPAKKQKPTNKKYSSSYTRDMDIDITTDDNELIENQPQPLKLVPSDKKTYSNKADMEIDLTSDDNDHFQDQRKPLETISSHERQHLKNKKISKSASYGNILNDNLLDIEAVRIFENPLVNPTATSTPNIPQLNQSNLTTPRPTSAMNVSDLNDPDMELTQLSNKSNFIMEQFRKENLRQSVEQPNVAEQILNDWETNLEDDIKSQHEPENNAIAMNTLFNDREVNHNFDENDNLKECFVFQKRFDNEDSDNSDIDEDDNCIKRNASINVLENSDLRINEDFVVMHNIVSNSNQNHVNHDIVWNTPGKNDMFVRNVSSKITTECQVTPTFVIMRQIKVSAKEAVLVRDTKHLYPKIKAKKNLNDFYNKAAVDRNPRSPIKNVLKIVDTTNKIVPLNENNTNRSYENPYLALNTKDKQNGFITDETTFTKNENIIKTKDKRNKNTSEQNPSNKPIITNATNLTLEPKLISNVTVNGDNPSSATSFSAITLQEKDNNYKNITLQNPLILPRENPITYDAAEISNANNEFEKKNTDRRLSQYNNSPEYIENANVSINNSTSIAGGFNKSLENGQELFENDLSELLDDYNTRLQIRMENARRQCQTNTADLYTKKLCEITESVLQRSEEQKKELDVLRSNMESLETQMEWHYQVFVKKTKQYDIYMEVTERALDALTQLDIKNQITTEHEKLMQQLKNVSNDVIQEVWNNYVEKEKQEYLSNIDDLSKI